MKERLREWALRLLGSFTNRQGEAEEELRFHLEMAEQNARQRGGSARDARLAAGGLTQAAEAVHDQRGIGWLGDFARTQTFTRFYIARRIGGHPAHMGWESQAVHLVTPAQARVLLNRDTDRAVLDALLAS